MAQPTEDNPYAPPRAMALGHPPRRSSAAVMGIIGGGSGLIFGWIDIHQVYPHFVTVLIWFYLAAAAALGGAYGLRAWWAVLLLGSSLCPVHMAAFAWGVRQPYVEENMGLTIVNLLLNVPCLVVFGVAVLLREAAKAGMASCRPSSGVPNADLQARPQLNQSRAKGGDYGHR